MERIAVVVCAFMLSAGLASSCSPPVPTEKAKQVSPTLEQVAQGRSQIVDLSHPLNERNPYWPGESYHPFRFEVLAQLEADGVYSGAFSAPEHSGTHLDAPNHFEAGQASVDKIPLTSLVAPAVVIDIQPSCERDPDYQLSLNDLKRWEEKWGPIPGSAVVYALTGWGRYWDNFEKYKNEDESGQLHFPGFSQEAARFLVEERDLRGLGIDTLSVDFGRSTDFSVHHTVHGSGGYHVENVANLGQVPQSGAWTIIAPIKIEGGSGGPARIWAVF